MYYSARQPEVIDFIVNVFSSSAKSQEIIQKISSSNSSDVEAIFEYATANGIYPIFVKTLLDTKVLPKLAGVDLSKIEDRLQAYEEINSHQEAITVEITQQLQQLGIECFVLKGSALIYLLYKEYESRPRRDLDLLLHSSSVDIAYDHFLSKGFIPDPSDKAEHHYPQLEKLYDNGIKVRLELHTRLVPSEIYGFPIYSPKLSEKPFFIDLKENIKIPTLSYEDHLVHMHLHLFHHIFYNFRFMHLLDIVLAARRWEQQIDWNNVLKRLNSAGIGHFTLCLWREIALLFNVELLPNLVEQVEYDFSKQFRWMLIHGSLPLMASFFFKESSTSKMKVAKAELERVFFRTFKVKGWGISKHKKPELWYKV